MIGYTRKFIKYFTFDLCFWIIRITFVHNTDSILENHFSFITPVFVGFKNLNKEVQQQTF